MADRAKRPTLYDWETNELLRKATREEEKRSVAAEKTDPDLGGMIIARVRGRKRKCFVWEENFLQEKHYSTTTTTPE